MVHVQSLCLEGKISFVLSSASLVPSPSACHLWPSWCSNPPPLYAVLLQKIRQDSFPVPWASREAHPEKLSSHCLLSQGHRCPGGGRLQQAAWAASLPSMLVHAWWIGQDVQPIKSKNPSLLCDLGNLSGQFHCRPCHNELFMAQQEDTLHLFMT